MVASRLQAAIAQKQDELHQRSADLHCPEYRDKEWPARETAMLDREIAEIQRFLEHGGELNLARCREDTICLVAHKGFLACTLRSGSCGFSYKVEPVQVKPRQEVLI